jgi:hypothetical protein
MSAFAVRPSPFDLRPSHRLDITIPDEEIERATGAGTPIGMEARLTARMLVQLVSSNLETMAAAADSARRHRQRRRQVAEGDPCRS